MNWVLSGWDDCVRIHGDDWGNYFMEFALCRCGCFVDLVCSKYGQEYLPKNWIVA